MKNPLHSKPGLLENALRLVWITDQRLTADQTLGVARKGLEGGLTAIQLRRHDLTAAELYALGTQLRRLSRERGAYLIVNDRIDVALAVEADGVHLGRHSLPLECSRVLVHGEMVVGYSAHSESEIAHAAIRGADYCSLSPIFPPISKPSGRPALGIEGLRRASSRSVLPIIALGGITEEHVAECIKAGAVGIAASGTLSDADAPDAVTAAMLKALGR